CVAWAGRGGACAGGCGAHIVAAHAMITMPRNRTRLRECISGILIPKVRRRAILPDLTHLNHAVQHTPEPRRATSTGFGGARVELRPRRGPACWRRSSAAR